MSRQITATTEGGVITFTDALDATWNRSAQAGDGYAYVENGRVFVNNGTADIFDVEYTEFATPSGASAAAVRTALNTNYFLTSGGGGLPSNVVLIESESDFPLGGGGTLYALEPDKIYQVVGEITGLDKNIEWGSNASIHGNDRRIDKLTFDAGFGFVGNKGITIKNLSLSTPTSGQLFNVTSVLTENINLESCVIRDCNNVGSISNVGASLNVKDCLFSGNTAGISLTATVVSVKDTFFANTNSGTYLTLTGTPAQIELSGNTFLTVPGTTALDISGVTPVGAATLINSTFFAIGGGTFTNGAFSNAWEVDSYGIDTQKDEFATGRFTVTTPAATTILVQNQWYKVAGTTTLSGNEFRVDDDGGTDNRLRYLGIKSVEKTVFGSVSITAASNNKTYELTFGKNGTPDATQAVRRKINTSADVEAIGVLGGFAFTTNDYVELFVRCIDATTANATVELANVKMS